MLIGPAPTRRRATPSPHKIKANPDELHRPADAGALDLARPSSTPASRRAMSTSAPSSSPAPTRSASCPAASPASRSRKARWSSIRARAAAPRTPGCSTHDDAPPGISNRSEASSHRSHANRCTPSRWALADSARSARAHAEPHRRHPLLAGRYVERADNTARIIDAASRLAAMPIAYAGALERMGVGARRRRRPRRLQRALRRAATATRSSTSSPSRRTTRRASSSCLETARNNGRAGPHRAHRRDVGGDQRRLARAQALRRHARWTARRSTTSSASVKEACLRFDGSAYRTMLRNDVYFFSRLGVYLERADNTARILDVKYHVLLPERGQRRRRPRLLPVVVDPALGLGAHRLSLGLSREPEALADRRPPDPQRADAALARELLREPRRPISTSCRRPMAARVRRSAPPARSAPGCRTPRSPTSSREGPARIPDRVHRRQRPPRRRDRRAVPRPERRRDAPPDPPRDRLPLRDAGEPGDPDPAADAARP